MLDNNYVYAQIEIVAAFFIVTKVFIIISKAISKPIIALCSFKNPFKKDFKEPYVASYSPLQGRT